MDLPAIFRRAPELCLIDELAHANAPGLEHEKRYEDIDDVLEAGIDVYSTVNVQHLESLNDQIAEMTGVRVRETFPDRVLTSADEVVLMDLTPEALIQRLREGKVCPQEGIETALDNFFRVENLATLREVALRQVAEDVESKRAVVPETPGTREEKLIAEAPQAVAERVLALASSGRSPSDSSGVPGAQRNGWAPSSMCCTWPSPAKSGEAREQLEALRRLVSVLGANLLVEEGDDVAEVTGRVASERGTTYILIAEPRSARGWRRFGESLPEKLLRKVPGVDIRIVADRAQLREGTG